MVPGRIWIPHRVERGADMAESNVLVGLVAKRGELAGEAEHDRRELHRLAEALSHVDATIPLFDSSY